ncbi:FtsW/RodA/SpoVE family cell cycle protein [uncultured Massilia sp.]|uniref:FtsW/RodA/SpoVE family cell cycle protein n=1 Tax=uncultured Massilia sp. TaxID=169973 RepID=UPI0025F1073C|nr:FtsW/RodA/SpoVE family cell cycle protein [uncultured Massilia sp.]
MNTALRLSARALAAAALLLACALQLLAVLRAPAAWMPDQITVTLARGAAITLGREALAAPLADDGQVRLRRDADGAWWLANAGAARLLLQDGDVRRRSGSVAPAAGQRFQLGAATFAVAVANEDGVELTAPGTRWHFDGALLRRDGAVQPACPDARIGARLAALWNRVAPGALALARPLVFGGNLDCGNRIAIAGLPAPAATLAREHGALLLAAATGPDAAPLLLHEGGRAGLLAQREERLAPAPGQALVAGRTRLLLAPNGDVLHLRPVSGVALYHEARARLPEGVAWTWTERAPWRLPPAAHVPLLAALVLALAAAGAAMAAGGRRAGRPPWTARAGAALRAGAGVLLLACGLIQLWLQRSGAPAGAGLALVPAWAALWCALLAPRRLDPALAAAVLLLAVGLLAQLELGLGAGDTSWLRHAGKTAAMIALGTGACLLAAFVRPALPPAQARVELALLALTGVALAGLVLQVAFGSETGVFDLQPVEFAKLALALLSAHCLALATASQPVPGGAWRRALRLVAPALLFMLLLAVAVVQVDDYSPLVLLAVWGGAMALAQALATRQRLVACLLLAGAASAVLGVALLRDAGPAEIARWDFYADRFLVWLDPAGHPHTGQQVLLGARAIAEGGWWGLDGMLGLGAPGPGAALRIPAVQDDFAPAFFLNRHGLAGALVLWLLQALLLAGLLRLALRCWLDGGRARDFRRSWLARFRCFFLAGGAAFVFGHVLLSWGTNLAIFPVMGQPMSFLSAGGSHLLFFIFPLLGFAAASSHTLEENDHAAHHADLRTT